MNGEQEQRLEIAKRLRAGRTLIKTEPLRHAWIDAVDREYAENFDLSPEHIDLIKMSGSVNIITTGGLYEIMHDFQQISRSQLETRLQKDWDYYVVRVANPEYPPVQMEKRILEAITAAANQQIPDLKIQLGEPVQFSDRPNLS